MVTGPPVSLMDGGDLVTEGILTITKVTRILKEYASSYILGKGPADRIVKLSNRVTKFISLSEPA